MSALATLVNVVAFTALFAAHASAAPVERPSGVRRALQIYAGELSKGASLALEPMSRLDGVQFFCPEHGAMAAGTQGSAKRPATLPCGRAISLVS